MDRRLKHCVAPATFSYVIPINNGDSEIKKELKIKLTYNVYRIILN